MEIKLTNVIPHEELNSLVSVASDEAYNICVGVSDMQRGHEPRFKVYNNRFACDATGGVEVSLIRPAFKNVDKVSIGPLFSGALHELCSRRYVIHKYSVFQVLCLLWNLTNEFIEIPADPDPDWSLMDDYAQGKFDTDKNLGTVGYIPSFATQPDYEHMDMDDPVDFWMW